MLSEGRGTRRGGEWGGVYSLINVTTLIGEGGGEKINVEGGRATMGRGPSIKSM